MNYCEKIFCALLCEKLNFTFEEGRKTASSPCRNFNLFISLVNILDKVITKGRFVSIHIHKFIWMVMLYLSVNKLFNGTTFCTHFQFHRIFFSWSDICLDMIFIVFQSGRNLLNKILSNICSLNYCWQLRNIKI